MEERSANVSIPLAYLPFPFQLSSSYKQTIGVDFFFKQLRLTSDVDVAIQLWDFGGQTVGGKMIRNYIYGAHAVILAYDISNHQSFQNLEDWYALVKHTFAGKTLPYVALMANKADLTHIRAVKPEMHNEFADENELYSYFVSAKTGDNVMSTFYRIAADLAGVVLSKPEFDSVGNVVKAEIVNHPNHPGFLHSGVLNKKKKVSAVCAVA